MPKSGIHPNALARLHPGEVACDIDGILVSRGARGDAAHLDVAFARRGPFSMSNKIYGGDRVARAVLSHIEVPLLFSSLIVMVLPSAAFDAPILFAEIHVLPTAQTRGFVDACGPAIATATFGAMFHEPLANVLDRAPSGVKRRIVPHWLAPFSGGSGARLSAPPLRGKAVSRVVIDYVREYMDGLNRAPAATDIRANERSLAALRDVVRERGKGEQRVGRVFGRAFATRWTQAIWPV